MKGAIAEFPGSFGVREAENLCHHLGASTSRVWFEAERLGDPDFVVIPSGASFADYVRPGALASRTKIAGAIKAFARAGGKVLGIGNGFQILCELNLLPGVLMCNKSTRFQSVTTHIRFEGGSNFLVKESSVSEYLAIPYACKYGAFYADRRTIQDIEEQKLILSKYVDQFGVEDEESPFAGSLSSIAALRNQGGNVVGIMPRIDRLDSSDIKRLFALDAAA